MCFTLFVFMCRRNGSFAFLFGEWLYFSFTLFFSLGFDMVGVKETIEGWVGLGGVGYHVKAIEGESEWKNCC